MKTIEYLKTMYRQKNYWQLVLYLTLGATLSTVVLILTYFLAKSLLYFFFSHFEAILMIVGGYIFAFLWLKDRGKQKYEQTKIEMEKADNSAQLLERALCETNYNIARNYLPNNSGLW